MSYTATWPLAKKTRIKGYYCCKNCGEFIRAIPKKIANCPFCNTECELLIKIDNVQERTTIALWKSLGIYSDKKADQLKIKRKESA